MIFLHKALLIWHGLPKAVRCGISPLTGRIDGRILVARDATIAALLWSVIWVMGSLGTATHFRIELTAAYWLTTFLVWGAFAGALLGAGHLALWWKRRSIFRTH